ncbi:MAG: DUF4338 domain-containing protein [Deltaproteobacteria bacterium]|nr:DUF4338 domain-containing protein [Deltaproteobacteria bacterium]
MEWEKLCGVEPVMVEIFVDRSRFRGIRYLEANWTHLGETKGLGGQKKQVCFPWPPKRPLYQVYKSTLR